MFNGTVLRKGIAYASLNLEFGYSNKTWGWRTAKETTIVVDMPRISRFSTGAGVMIASGSTIPQTIWPRIRMITGISAGSPELDGGKPAGERRSRPFS
ncbi:MAG: hypothetical protein U0936_26245 [Planctomycetaceae bacterium]